MLDDRTGSTRQVPNPIGTLIWAADANRFDLVAAGTRIGKSFHAMKVDALRRALNPSPDKS
jgi:hypothetical protein